DDLLDRGDPFVALCFPVFHGVPGRLLGLCLGLHGFSSFHPDSACRSFILADGPIAGKPTRDTDRGPAVRSRGHGRDPPSRHARRISWRVEVREYILDSTSIRPAQARATA